MRDRTLVIRQNNTIENYTKQKIPKIETVSMDLTELIKKVFRN